MNDAQLVARVRDGERDAFGELVRRHQQALYRHARGMGIDHDTSLDLVQDAFIKGYTRLRDCKDPAHVRAWLFRIVRNVCLDYLKNVRRANISLDDMAEVAVNDAEMVTVTNVLDKLPVVLREAFLLKHDAGYTYDEIAEMTSASPSAVKMRVHRACEVMQKLLADVTIESPLVVSNTK
jgi:RNA polymerase sigma-70 factor (ECF subfamily)